jgi:hypothetical protein
MSTDKKKQSFREWLPWKKQLNAHFLSLSLGIDVEDNWESASKN